MAIGAAYIGSDPELFVLDKDGKAVSAHLFEMAVAVNDVQAHGLRYSVKRDGAAVEVNHSPIYCRDYIVPSYYRALMHIQKKTKKYGTLVFDSAVELNDESMSDPNAPEDVRQFGCQPDFSAYTLREKAPMLPDGDPRRFAGGHIHISVNSITNGAVEPTMDQAGVAVIMDYLAGLPAVAMLGSVHEQGERERREFYGQAGSFRPKHYGIEYRTLSTKALFLHPSLMYMMLQSAKAASLKASRGNVIDIVKTQLNLSQLDEMRRIINEHDWDAAIKLISSTEWQSNARFFGLEDSSVLKVMEAVARAASEGVTWSNDLTHNWGLYTTMETKYGTTNHRYWGPDFIARYEVDELIFPQYPFLDREYKSKIGQRPTLLRHPLNPDFAKYGIKGHVDRERTIFE